ncbi:hypothetical protein [Nocardioides sp. T2.26MG-1]|uniref:hypothetical protein n=1 Tax=Nocardioides sp. T2.26MG-1 TaxID=3041166 RepID=UPI00254077B0|nr:hypothetical protein [Nocardioides sp. T2.26MG-1]
MSATHVSGRHARLDVSIDGVRITRTASDAARRHVDRTSEIGWDDVTGAVLQTSRKGRAIVRVLVADAAVVEKHRDDPYAVKVFRGDTADASAVVELIEHEVRVRRDWREQAAGSALG